MSATEKDSDHARLFDKAFRLQQQKAYPAAIAAYQALLKTNPDHVLGHFNLGTAFEKVGEEEAAFYAYQRAAQIDPGFTKAHLNIGVLLENNERYEDAVAVYQQALEFNANLGRLYTNLCNALSQLKKKDEAVRAGEQAVKHSPDLANAHNNLGLAYLNTRQFESAESCFKQALAIEPHMKLAMGNMALALGRQNRYQESREWYTRVLRDYPQYAKARINYAWLLICLRRWDESVKMSTSAMQLLLREMEPVVPEAVSLPPKILYSHDCLESLVRFRDVLARHDIDIFLVYGTLLGCMRDKDFISYDTDIDVGIWSDAPITRLIGELAENGFELRLGYDKNSKVTFDEVLRNTINFPFYYKGKIPVDVYRHFPKGDKIHSGFELGGHGLMYEVSEFELQQVELLGEMFMAPKDYETYLTECYGDWNVPDTLFETSVSSPNLVGGFPEHARALAYHRAVSKMSKNKYEACLYILKALEAKDASLEESIVSIREQLESRMG